MKFNAYILLLFLVCMCVSSIGYAQNEVTEGTYNLRFKPPTVDCSGEQPVYCTVVQIQSGVVGEDFSIGAHTIYLFFNADAIQFDPGVAPPYTSLTFGDGTACAFNGTQVPYFAADFDYINAQPDGSPLGEGNMTTNMALPNFGCPLVDVDPNDGANGWIDVGQYCWVVIDENEPVNITFDPVLTEFNLDSNVPEHTQGILDDAAVQGAAACISCPVAGDFTPANGSEDLCSSNTAATLPVVNVTGSGADAAVYTWTQTAGPSVSVSPGQSPSFNFAAVTDCTPVTYSFSLNIGCADDAAVSLDGGTYSYTVYPQPTSPSILQTSSGQICTYSVEAACPSIDVLSNTDVPNQLSGTTGQTFSLEVSNAACAAVAFTIPVPDCYAACPTQADVNPTAEVMDLCGDFTNDETLPLVGIGGANANKGTYTWTQTGGPSSINIGTGVTPSISLPANASDCDVETYTFSLTISCEDNPAVSINGGTVTYNVYPVPAAPRINRVNDVCEYVIETNCDFDVLSVTSIPNQAPGSSASTISIGVSNPGCGSGPTGPTPVPFDVEIPACPEEPIACPNSADVTAFLDVSLDICPSDNNVTFPTASISGANAGNATFTWSQTEGPTVNVSQIAQPSISLPANTGCDAITYAFNLTVGCSEDSGLGFDGGTVTYVVYPSPQSPSIQRLNDVCEYIIEPACPNDILIPSTVDPKNPGVGATQLEVSVANASCTSDGQSFLLTVDACPGIPTDDCPTSNDFGAASGTEMICATDLNRELPFVSVSGDGAGNATFTWTQTGGPSINVGSGNNPSITLTAPTGCSSEVFSFSLSIGCSEDSSVDLDGGDHSFIVYPQPTSPTISRLNNVCEYAISPACPDDILSDTDVPNQAPGGTGASFSVTVSNPGCTTGAFFSVNLPDCPSEAIDCPETSDFTALNITEELCGSTDNEVTFPALSVNNSNAFVGWIQNSGPVVNIGAESTPSVTLGANNSCSPVVYSFQAIVGCTQDAGVVLDGGSVAYTVYPTPKAPTIARISGVCEYVINKNCNDDVLSTNTVGNEDPGFAGGSIPIAVSNGVCTSVTFDVAIPECPNNQVDCPSQTDIVTVNETLEICNNESGNLVSLPTVEVTGEFANKATFTWTQISGPSVSIPAGTAPSVELLQNATCDPVSYIFSLTIGCTDDSGLSLVGGLVTYRLYPDAKAPTIARLNDVCEYSLTPNCPNDVLSPATVPSQALGTSGATFSVEVNNGICNNSLVVPIPDCTVQAVNCPTQADVNSFSGVTQLCNDPAGNAFTLPNVSVSGANAGRAIFNWEQTAGPSVEVPNGASPSLTLLQNATCEAATYTFKLNITCTDDPEVLLDGGEITVVVYAAPQAPVISRLNAVCEYSITPACPGDILSTTDVPTQNPGDASSSLNVEVSNAGCTAVAFEVTIPACPQFSTCPEQTDVEPVSTNETFCLTAAQDIQLPIVAVSGANADKATFTWTQIGGTSLSIEQGAISLPVNETCEVASYVFSLIIGCTEDESLSLNGGTAVYTVYPQIQEPTIVRLNEICEYSITAVCPDDVLSPATIANQTPGTAAQAITVEVSREGCGSTSFDMMIPECTDIPVPCPTADDVVSNSFVEEICGGEDASISLPEATISGLGIGKATYTWMQTAGPSVSISGGANPTVVLNNDNACETVSYTFVLTIGCIDDESVAIEVGPFTYTVYPAVQAPTVMNDGLNNFTVTTVCDGDVADPSEFSLVPGDSNMVTINVDGNGGICPKANFDVEVEILEPNCPEINCKIRFDNGKTLYYILAVPSGGVPSGGEGNYTIILEDGSEITAFPDVATVLGPYPFFGASQSVLLEVTDGSNCPNGFCEVLVTTTVDVELLDFSGEVLPTGNELNWITANEIDHDYFKLLRSDDGNNYETIAIVDAIGQEAQGSTYSYLDKQGFTGIVYYQLEMVDLEGNSTFSNTITLHKERSGTGIIDIAPVPTQDQLNITYSVTDAKVIDLQIFDTLGQLVRTIKADVSQVGINQISLDINALPTGVYFLQLSDGKQLDSRKIIKE